MISRFIQSKRLRSQWKKTSRAINRQATEMRRAVQHLSSSAVQNDDAFLALKSKVNILFHSVKYKQKAFDC